MTEPTSGVTSQNEDAALDNPAGKGPTRPQKDPKITEREELLARMDSRVDQMRADEDKYFLASADVDPRAAALAVQMAKEARGESIPADKGHRDEGATGGEGEEPEPGATYVEPVHAEAEDDAAKKARAAVRISNKGEDPLGDYVVRVEGKPMFKTVVDGQEKLIPLETARRQLQQHLAADIRFQQAKEQRRELDARERTIRQTEATLRARSAAPVAPPAPVVDDKALDAEAVEIVRSLVTEPEDKAAARLAKTLRLVRQAPAAPSVDAEAIAAAAADRAVRTIAERDNNRALGEGLKAFTKNYPDIAADSDLFNLADRKTNAIAEEHPDWSPEQVMNEAGRQTREWLKTLGAPVKTGANGGTPPQNNRQQLKQKLTPMPRPRSAAGAGPEAEDEGESPQATLAAIRKARGQAY